MTHTLITALGAVTSVGLDAVTTCASIRAGISRPALLIEHEVLDREEQAPVGITGHPVELVTRGFSGVGRWLQMAALALEDLSRSANLPGPDHTPFWSTTLCYVVVPTLDVQRFMLEPAYASSQAVTDGFLRPLDARVTPFFSLSRSVAWCRGRIGVLEAVQLAADHFRHRQCERVVVLAVDSLADGLGLSWLAEHGRLKHDDNPVGLAPGEGAAAFMLEAPWAAAARRAPVFGHVGSVASGREPETPLDADRSPGQELARIVELVLTTDGGRLPYDAPTITDLNGEAWRAKEHGHARVRVPRSKWDGDAVELPASCVGDLGAAMTALQVVLACRSLARGYAGSDRLLLAASDEYGHVGAAMIHKGLELSRTRTS